MIGHDRNEAKEKLLWDQFHASRQVRARAEILEMYEPFARSIAARMYGSRLDNSVSFDDYMQYGRLGLMEAIDRFDSNREVAFSAYAATRIRGAILNGIAKESEAAAQHRFWKRLLRDRLDSICTAVAPMADRASLAQIASITVGLALGALLEGSEEGFEPADNNTNSNPYAANEVRQLSTVVRQLVEQLPERERIIIKGHYTEHKEFQAIAEQLSITKGRVAQIHARALQRLRDALELTPKLDRKL